MPPLQKRLYRCGEQIVLDLSKTDGQKIVKKHTTLLNSCIKNFLGLDKVKRYEIQQVVLVGGASRMPLFSKLVEKLTSIKPLIDTNPDEISYGAYKRM